MKKSLIFLMTLVMMLIICNEILAQGLDATIREASNYLNERIPYKSKVVILNVESTSDALSDYIIEELVANAVNDGNFTVVDRKQLNDIQAELNFQLSGEVADNQAVAIGQKFGAQTIVSGRVSPIGENFRVSVRALSVESASIQAQFNKNIPTDPTISALMKVPNTPRPTAQINTTTSTRPVSSPSPTTPITTDTTPPPATKEYNICDVGPAGGFIFYDKGSYSNGWRYLETAPANSEFEADWGLDGIKCPGTSTGIGSGKSNTAVIIRFLIDNEETAKAAQVCDILSINGYDDWFLPSIDELKLMYQNLAENGYGRFRKTSSDGVYGSIYWSSSLDELWNNRALGASFSHYQGGNLYPRYRKFTVRAVRSF